LFPERVAHKITPTSHEERVAIAVQAAACFAGLATLAQQLVKQSPAGRSEHDRAAARGRSRSGRRQDGMTDTDHLPFYSRQTGPGREQHAIDPRPAIALLRANVGWAEPPPLGRSR